MSMKHLYLVIGIISIFVFFFWIFHDRAPVDRGKLVIAPCGGCKGGWSGRCYQPFGSLRTLVQPFGLDWVDPKVTGFTSVFTDVASISSFIGKHSILKSKANDGILVVDYCRPTDTICMGRSPSKGPFFFIYSCLFSDLHVALPCDDFMTGVLQTLNVAPS